MPVFQVLSRTVPLSAPPKKRTRRFPSQWYVVARALVSGLVGGAIFTLLARFGPTVFFLLPVLVSLSWGQPQRYDIIKLLHSTPVYLLLTICLTLIYFSVVTVVNLLIHQSTVSHIILITTALAWAIILEPARVYVQQFIERRFNLRNRKAVKAIEAFTATLREEIDLDSLRERFLTPRLRVNSYDELNGWLLDKCIAYAKAHRHPELRDRTIWEAFEAERPSFVPYAGRFNGFHAVPASVSKTCLVRFDNNKYSVAASAVGRPVEIRAYADRIELRQDGRIVGEHRRCFGRDQTVFDPWHYVPVLARKPGALRNGAPFKDWILPASLDRVRRKLAAADDGDRQMVDILTAVLSDGLPAVEAACSEALRDGVHSAGVILNILSRRREPTAPITIMTPDALRLRHEPAADCARYDSLRRAL